MSEVGESAETVHMLTDQEKALRERLAAEDWMIVKAGFRRSYDQGRDDEQDRMLTKGYRDTGEDFCCVLGCGSGACESCPCCGAGWCVMGRDGIPGDENNPGPTAEDQADWLEIAAEHNPIAAALLACREQRDDLRELLDAERAERTNPPAQPTQPETTP